MMALPALRSTTIVLPDNICHVSAWQAAQDRLDEPRSRTLMCSVAGDGCPAGWLHPNDGSTSRRQGDARTPNRPGITSRRTARMRRGGRVVEGARLESVFTGDRNAGSNPALSARLSRSHLFLLYFSEHPDNHPTHYPTLFQDCTGSLRTSQFNLERIARENRKTALRLISAAEISFAVARKRTLPAPSLKSRTIGPDRAVGLLPRSSRFHRRIRCRIFGVFRRVAAG